MVDQNGKLSDLHTDLKRRRNRNTLCQLQVVAHNSKNRICRVYCKLEHVNLVRLIGVKFR